MPIVTKEIRFRERDTCPMVAGLAFLGEPARNRRVNCIGVNRRLVVLYFKSSS